MDAAPRMGLNPDAQNIDDTTVHGDLRRRHTLRDNGTCHRVEHHRRGMRMAEPSVVQRDLQEKDHGPNGPNPKNESAMDEEICTPLHRGHN